MADSGSEEGEIAGHCPPPPPPLLPEEEEEEEEVAAPPARGGGDKTAKKKKKTAGHTIGAMARSPRAPYMVLPQFLDVYGKDVRLQGP